jgi:hypothetical protein
MKKREDMTPYERECWDYMPIEQRITAYFDALHKRLDRLEENLNIDVEGNCACNRELTQSTTGEELMCSGCGKVFKNR